MFRCYVICPMTSTVNLKKRIRVIAKIALANQLSGIRLVSSALASFKVLLGRRRWAYLLRGNSKKRRGFICLQLNFILVTEQMMWRHVIRQYEGNTNRTAREG